LPVARLVAGGQTVAEVAVPRYSGLDACPVYSSAPDRLYRIRVARSDRDPRSIRVALSDSNQMGQVEAESVIFGLARLWHTERHPPESESG